jgi:hypothetical protein
MPVLTIRERTVRIERGKQAMRALSTADSASRTDLGRGRDLLNLIYRVQDLTLVNQWTDELEVLAHNVAGYEIPA